MGLDLNDVMKNMTEEEKTMVKKCKTPEEFMQLVQDKRIELTEEQLKLVAGGYDEHCPGHCPRICLFEGCEKEMPDPCYRNPFTDICGGGYFCGNNECPGYVSN